jgi:uncharacterized protein YndB with AHSA1/START domain
VAKAKGSITINAPVEKVFAYWNEPSHLLETWPSVVEVKDVQQLPNGGHFFRYVYKMLGVRLEGTSQDIEIVANQRTVNKTKGGIESTLTAVFEPEDDGTRMSFEVEYVVPIPVLGKVAEAIIVRANDREMALMLANLKDHLEG